MDHAEPCTGSWPTPAPPRPLIVTADETRLDALLRLAAAAGVTPDVAPDPVAARRLWAAASL
ncbi:MAG: hypothetical protein M3165_01510, partial [Actinomycetota bacterium]|nr:hypothetical protein [Actinomycetota bacterium]